MRANDGEVRGGPLAGHPLLIMTSTGAKTGEPRRAILTYHKDGDDYVVAGTAGGAPTTPSWVYNVDADPEVTIEVGKRRSGRRRRWWGRARSVIDFGTRTSSACHGSPTTRPRRVGSSR